MERKYAGVKGNLTWASRIRKTIRGRILAIFLYGELIGPDHMRSMSVPQVYPFSIKPRILIFSYSKSRRSSSLDMCRCSSNRSSRSRHLCYLKLKKEPRQKSKGWLKCATPATEQTHFNMLPLLSITTGLNIPHISTLIGGVAVEPPSDVPGAPKLADLSAAKPYLEPSPPISQNHNHGPGVNGPCRYLSVERRSHLKGTRLPMV